MHDEYEVRAEASRLVPLIADTPNDGDVMSPRGAAYIANALLTVPQPLRRSVFGLLDDKPGLWGYTLPDGRSWHHNVRQMRNRHVQLLTTVFDTP
jgi:hypothetical protein